MAHLTEEEADRLDELYTKTTPKIDPDKPGIFSQMRKEATPIFVDEFTARYITGKAIATNRTPSEIVYDMVRSDIASGQ